LGFFTSNILSDSGFFGPGKPAAGRLPSSNRRATIFSPPTAYCLDAAKTLSPVLFRQQTKGRLPAKTGGRPIYSC